MEETLEYQVEYPQEVAEVEEEVEEDSLLQHQPVADDFGYVCLDKGKKVSERR